MPAGSFWAPGPGSSANSGDNDGHLSCVSRATAIELVEHRTDRRGPRTPHYPLLDGVHLPVEGACIEIEYALRANLLTVRDLVYQ